MFDEKVVAADMLDFMKEFRVAHPSYFDGPLYVTGESYGGHYVPAVTYGLFQYNKVRCGCLAVCIRPRVLGPTQVIVFSHESCRLPRSPSI